MRKTAILLLAATLISGCQFDFDFPNHQEPITNVFSGIPQKDIDEYFSTMAIASFGHGFFFARTKPSQKQFTEEINQIEVDRKIGLRVWSNKYRRNHNLPPLPEELQQ